MQPVNQAAQLVLNAQSVIGDLMIQAAEIQRAIERQQAVIDQVMPATVWVEPEPVEVTSPDLSVGEPDGEPDAEPEQAPQGPESPAAGGAFLIEEGD